MSEYDKRKRFILDEFHLSHEFNTNHINLQEVATNCLVGKFDIDNISKWIKHKETKMIIHDFYKKGYKYFVSVGVDELLSNPSTADEGYRFIMFQLQEELAYKDEYQSLNELETVLQLILSNDSLKKHKYVYSDRLVNEFKNVLKEVE